MVADELKVCEVELGMIRAMCGVKLVGRVSSDVLVEREDFVVKIKDILVHSWDIDSLICEVMELETEEKRKKECIRKSWEGCIKMIWCYLDWNKRMQKIAKISMPRLKPKLLATACQDNDINMQGLIQAKNDSGYCFWAQEFLHPNSIFFFFLTSLYWQK